MSFMNTAKRVGPSTEPWGIPLSTSSQFDKLPSKHTLCFLSVRKVSIHRMIFPVTPAEILLQSLAKEITPVVHFIFTQSLCTGELPTEWTQANVVPIFKKGSKLQAVNYCPVSLTCNLFEHIICQHILAHLEDHKILPDLQHGFRSG